MKKIIYLLYLLILMSLNASAAQPLTVLLDWFPNPNHAPLFVAMEQGFFKANGLEVKLIGPADPTDPPKLVAAGKADIAMTYEPQFLQQVDSGLPLILLGTLIDKPLACMVALKANHIYQIADLKGKRIGTSVEGATDLILKSMLEKNKLTLQDVTLISIHFNLTQALLSHNIDAATGMMRNYEVPQLEMTGHPVSVFYPEDFGIPLYSELIFVTQKKLINDPRMIRFLTAVKQATAYLKKHPEEMWSLFAKTYPENNNAFSKKAWLITLPYFSDDPTQLNTKQWLDFSILMQRNDLIKQVQPVSEYTHQWK